MSVNLADFIPSFEHKRLDNLLDVYATDLKNNSDVISLDLFFKVGSKDEQMGKTGLAHMLEHMSFKSSKNLKEGEFDKIVKKMGGIDNASTGFDYTHYYIKTTSSNINKGLELFKSIMSELLFVESEFLKEQKVVLEERFLRVDNSPEGLMFFSLFNEAFREHAYHWTPIGFRQDIENYTTNDLKNFYKTYYQPQNAILLVSGDLKSFDIFSAAQKAFGNIKNTQKLPTNTVIEPVQKDNRVVVSYNKSKSESLILAYKIGNFLDESIASLKLIAEILSSGASSRLEKNLVDKDLASSVSAFLFETKDPGLFIISARCLVGVDAFLVKEKIEKELKNLLTNLTDKEIQRAKKNLELDFISSFEDCSGVSSIFGAYLSMGSLEPILNYQKNLEAINKERLKSTIKKFFDPKTSTTLILKQG